MNIVKWDPFVELEDVSKQLNRIFGRFPARSEPARELLATADWAPSVDIAETETAYLIKSEIPGVNREDVKVNIENGMLTMSGERKQEKEEKGKKFHRVERSYGSFMRSFRLPDNVDEAAVKAEFKDGMLNVTLPKTTQPKNKAISINVS
ncbi:MAG: Hsp20/alpha crystallin family protein [Gallionella sp.]|nr:Hsp20/alpha crystallin family protein [Gallionella sp.]